MPEGIAAKLVRDRIPEIIRRTGVEPIVRAADAQEYRGLLRAKLVEEATECRDSASADELAEELADVLEVVHALADAHGIDQDRLEKLREAKAVERGGFVERLVWSGNRREQDWQQT